MRGIERQRAHELETARAGVDFGKCQLDRVVSSYQTNPQRVEFEAFSPYLQDYDMVRGEIWQDRLARHDAIGLAITRILRSSFPEARLVSLYDEYTSDMPDSADVRGMPQTGGPQLAFLEQTRLAFRKSVEEVLRAQGGIRPQDKEGTDYWFVSESEKVKDTERLVQELEQKGFIERRKNGIYFVNPSAENPQCREICLQSKQGHWQCVALDTSAFLKPWNREITHLVVLPKSFEDQQDKVWEILRVLEIARPDTYHNIFFDDTLAPEVAAQAIREKIEDEMRTQAVGEPATRVAA